MTWNNIRQVTCEGCSRRPDCAAGTMECKYCGNNPYNVSPRREPGRDGGATPASKTPPPTAVNRSVNRRAAESKPKVPVMSRELADAIDKLDRLIQGG